MKRFSLPCVMTVIFYALLHPVHAEEAVFFSSPSKNIYCVYDPARAAQPPHLPRTEALIRCDIMQFTPTLSEVPTQTKDEIAALGKCTLRQMKAFVIAETATKSTTYCPTDMPGPEQFVLDYGKSYSKGGLTCLSEMKGMTCQNSLGHGFFYPEHRNAYFKQQQRSKRDDIPNNISGYVMPYDFYFVFCGRNKKYSYNCWRA